MNAKHTPGPWVANTLWTVVNIRAAGGSVCNVPRNCALSDDIEANARLIAAAPELLEALKRVLDDEGIAISRPDFELARAAIDKATSSTPSSALPAEGSTAPVIEALPVQGSEAGR